MSASTQNGGGIEHWLKEEMELWHTFPLFLAMALLGWGAVEVVGLFIAVSPDASVKIIGAAALFAGVAMGWTARRQHESDS